MLALIWCYCSFVRCNNGNGIGYVDWDYVWSLLIKSIKKVLFYFFLYIHIILYLS